MKTQSRFKRIARRRQESELKPDDLPESAAPRPRPADEESTSSEDEGPFNTRGDVPANWYDDTPHIGYDRDGKPIMRPAGTPAERLKSALDALVQRADDPTYLRTVYDTLHEAYHVLTDEELAVIENLLNNRFPNPHYDPYQDQIEWVDFGDDNPFDADPVKKRFTPNVWEARRITQLVRLIRRGIVTTDKTPAPKDALATDVWADAPPLSKELQKRLKYRIPPPRAQLPRSSESYRPPAHLLPTKTQFDAWHTTHKRDRKPYEFLPTQFNTLREVPWYAQTIRERYQRCTDILDATRKQRKRKYDDPMKLLPELPPPQDLRPFPVRNSVVFTPPEKTEGRGLLKLRTVSVSPSGRWVAVGAEDCVVRVYETATGRQMWAYRLPAAIKVVAWNPNPRFHLLSVAAGPVVYMFIPRPCGTVAACEETSSFLRGGLQPVAADEEDEAKAAKADGDDASDASSETDDEELDGIDEEPEAASRLHLVTWVGAPSPRHLAAGLAMRIVHAANVEALRWHDRGDYFATLCPRDPLKKRIVLVLQLSRRRALNPFPGLAKFRDRVTDIAFFKYEGEQRIAVGLKRSIRLFSLVSGRLIKRLTAPVTNISEIAVHPNGGHMLASTHDGDALWWDLEDKPQPYRRMRTHRRGVQAVAVHPRADLYPLFATASDDGTIHVFHANVHEDDISARPTIVPLKTLRGHAVVGHVGVTRLAWHPTLPWLISVGVDGTTRVWTE